jgi:MFS transporter, DHA2 family, multidrug resistance protein
MLALIRTMFRDDAPRAAAIGVWTAAFTSGMALGPIVGGLLLEHF